MGFFRKVEKEVKRAGRKIDDEILQPVKNTVEAIVEDPKKLAAVAIAVAFPGAGAALGAQLGLSGVAAQVVGQTLLNTALNGGDVKSAVISAALPVVGQAGANALSSTLASSGIEGAVNTVITRAVTQGTTAAILGKDPLSAALLGGVTAGVNAIVPDIPGYNDLPAAAKNAINSAIATKLTGGNVGGAVSQSLVNDAIAWAKSEVNKTPDALKAAQAAYKADTGTNLSDGQAAELLSVYGADGIAAAADRLTTSQQEAREIWKQTVGTEPTEFDLMEIIGLDEGQASSIAYDQADTSTEEAEAFFKDLYGADYKPTTEQLMEIMGRPESAAKADVQNAYTKDKNWVTEDEAAQFWKDTGNTGPVPQEFLDSMLMTTENGAKAMSEAHRINAEDIAATTFDGSQYATPQEAAAAAKAAGFNAFTHKDKNLTYFTQPSPIEEANIRADVEEKKTFNEAFAAARKELGAGKTFTWNGKQYTTNVTPKDTFDASRSSNVTTAATLAYANGKDKFIGPDGKTYALDNSVKSILENSVNQSEAETQRLLRQAIKPATNETAAETQRLMESGTRGTMDTIGAMTAQALGTTQRGLGNFLSNAGKTYAAMTGDLDFDNAASKLGKEIENYAKGSDIYGLDVQKNRLSQAMARANETDNWIEKTKILGSAIGKNSLGFFDVAGSEVVEELPETILQIGTALMTGGGTLAAKGAVAAIGAAGSVMETFGSTVEETYDKAKKAGASDSEAMNKAYINGVLSTAIEAGTNFVADKAMLAPFLNKFTGTLAGTATGFVSSTAIGAASELAAGLSQSYATQYAINPETASLSKAATDGIFEMFIGGTAQGAMGLPGYAIQGGAIIGKDYSGKDVTVADVAAGAVLDSSTVNPNATIATSEDGDPVTLGGAMLQMPNYQFDMSTLKTYVPQVFNNDDLVVGQDELGNTVTYGDLLGQTTESKGFDAVYKSLMDITPEQRTEAKYDFVSDLYSGLGYKPTTQEINNLIAQNPDVSQIDKAEVDKYVDSRLVTEQEAKDAYAALGVIRPTQADVLKLVGQYDQTGLTGKAAENMDAARYNSLLQQIEQLGTQAGVDPAALEAIKKDLNAQITALGGDVTKLQAGLNSVASNQTAAATQVSNLQKSLSDEIKAAKDIGLQGDAAIQAGLNSLAAKVGANQADVLKQLGTTEAALKTQFASEISGVKTELAQTEKDILAQVAKNEAAGMSRDAALQKAISDVAATQKTDVASLLSKMGTTEAALKTQFSTDIAASQKATAQEITKTKTALETAIADAKASGLQGDAALKSAIDAVAANQKTNAADLLTKLGTTESGLKTEFAAGLAGVSAEVADTRKTLEDAIQAAKDIGLQGDAALQAGIDSVASSLGTTKEALLSQLGTTEGALRTEFATGITGLETQMKAQYDALTAAQKAEADARLAQGQTLEQALAAAQATTAGQISGLEAQTKAQYESLTAAQKAAADALVAQGQTLASAITAAKTETASQIANVETRLTDAIAAAEAMGLSRDQAITAAVDSVAAELGTTRANLLTQLGTTEAALRTEFAAGISGLEAQTKAQYDSLSAAQKATADALVAQGQSMQQAISAAQQQTAGQIAGVETRLTDAIAAAEAMGLSRDQAITAAVESVAADLGTTKAALLTQLGTTEAALRTEFTTGLAGVSAEVKAAYSSLTAEQKALANQLTQQGTDLATAIQTAQQQTQGQIGALSADMQAKYDSLSAEQKALANDMAQQGMDLTAAINLAQQQTQAQITGLGQQVDTRINELMQQGQTYQQATQQAIGELNQQNQQLRGLVGTQGRSATQADIDAMSQMLGGQRSMDLTYDVTGDKQITQADIDFLTQVVGGTNTDWKAPVGSAFGPTGLYGQLASNEAQRQADLQAQLAREQAAEQARVAQAAQAAAAAKEAQRQAAIRTGLGQGQQQLQQIAKQIPQALQQAQTTTTPIYGEMGQYLDLGSPLDFDFFKPSPEKQAATKQQQPTKIAAGGYIDDLLAGDMTVDELLNLLR